MNWHILALTQKNLSDALGMQVPWAACFKGALQAVHLFSPKPWFWVPGERWLGTWGPRTLCLNSQAALGRARRSRSQGACLSTISNSPQEECLSQRFLFPLVLASRFCTLKICFDEAHLSQRHWTLSPSQLAPFLCFLCNDFQKLCQPHFGFDYFFIKEKAKQVVRGKEPTHLESKMENGGWALG